MHRHLGDGEKVTDAMPTTPGPATTPQEWLPRLASLAHAIRPDWDEQGIHAQLRKVSDRPLVDLAAATIDVCRRHDQRTPKVIALDGPHWRTNTQQTDQPTNSTITTRCEHGLEGVKCHDCYPPPGTHTGIPMPAYVREELRKARQEPRK